ncbi:MAG: two-component system nitrate/nitrite response regulator NarL [Oceanicoccus sp.]|jgi:two-component system nitrate/nitrite response regulator NarL
MIKLFLVDDHPMMRRGMKQLLDLHEDMQVIGEACSGEEACTFLKSIDPDIILLDLNMKGMSGIDTLYKLREQEVTARIVMVTVSDDYDDVIAAIRAGADGYVLKDAEPEELIAAVRNVFQGQLVVSPELSKALAAGLRSENPNVSDVLATLTLREREVLKLIVKGRANKFIATSLSIAEATVKVHVKNLLKKLKLRSRLEAAVWAAENGLL